jgi:CRP/FNR family cyclic AMP-dependent transcriptional regulator
VLLLPADIGKDGKTEAVIAKISQESLAEMIGTTRSRVSFFMNKFASWGSSPTIAALFASTARC